jgi:hypothetical protein
LTNTLAKLASYFALALALVACGPIKLVSDYDEKLDQGVTDIQKKVESALTKIERSPKNPSATYVAADYEAIKEDLNVLITRADSADKNEITVKQLYTLSYALLQNPSIAPGQLNLPRSPAEMSLQARHSQSNGFGSEDLRDLRTILGVNFRSILKFELAKKRGSGESTK